MPTLTYTNKTTAVQPEAQASSTTSAATSSLPLRPLTGSALASIPRAHNSNNNAPMVSNSYAASEKPSTAPSSRQRAIEPGDYIKIFWGNKEAYFCTVIRFNENKTQIRVCYDDNEWYWEPLAGLNFEHTRNNKPKTDLKFKDPHDNSRYIVSKEDGKVYLQSQLRPSHSNNASSSNNTNSSSNITNNSSTKLDTLAIYDSITKKQYSKDQADKIISRNKPNDVLRIIELTDAMLAAGFSINQTAVAACSCYSGESSMLAALDSYKQLEQLLYTKDEVVSIVRYKAGQSKADKVLKAHAILNKHGFTNANIASIAGENCGNRNIDVLLIAYDALKAMGLSNNDMVAMIKRSSANKMVNKLKEMKLKFQDLNTLNLIDSTIHKLSNNTLSVTYSAQDSAEIVEQPLSTNKDVATSSSNANSANNSSSNSSSSNNTSSNTHITFTQGGIDTEESMDYTTSTHDDEDMPATNNNNEKTTMLSTTVPATALPTTVAPAAAVPAVLPLAPATATAPATMDIDYDAQIAETAKLMAETAKRLDQEKQRLAALAKLVQEEEQRIAEEDKLADEQAAKVEELKRAKRQKLDKEVSNAGTEYESAVQQQTTFYKTMLETLDKQEELFHKVRQAKQKLEQKAGTQNLNEYVAKNPTLFTPGFTNSIKEANQANEQVRDRIKLYISRHTQ